MLRVGIDVSSLPYARGVSRYTTNLVRALKARSDVSCYLYGNALHSFARLQREAQQLGVEDDHLFLQKIPSQLIDLAWRYGFLSVSKRLPKIEVFHSWDWLQPPDRQMPLVSTIHDLAMLRFPETAHPSILKHHQRSWQILKERRSQIIAVSQSTKEDIVNLLQIPQHRISVIYEALPQEIINTAEYLEEDQYANIQAQLNLTKPYLLFVGTREPRKNIMRLIEAWQPLHTDIELVIAGEVGWDATTDTQAKLLRTPGLRFIGQVNTYQLVVLYSEASCFVYPSLSEGFGLPILEAFYFGTPVVTADVSSMPEVAGNAAILIDPLSPESIRAGIQTILNESPVAQKKRLQRMMIRLQLFSWEKAAMDTMTVYKKAVQQHAL